MLTLLVLCVDRDNDLGQKTGLKGPVLGREEVLQASMSLGLADPEESDTNAMLAAVNILDEITGSGTEAEVAVLTGNRDVGQVSDRIVAEQLDEVLERVDPQSVIYVTDGVEDEFLLPLVTSRVRVDAIKRVIVRQHHDLEGIYYVVKRAIEDDKIQRTIFVPAALALVVYGIAAVGGYERVGLGAIALTIGLYFLVKGLRLGPLLNEVIADTYEGMRSSRFTVFTSFFAFALVISGVIAAGQRAASFGEGVDWVQQGLIFVQAATWWAVAAAVITTLGHTVDVALQIKRVPWGHITTLLIIVAAGLGLSLVLSIALRSLGPVPGSTFFTPEDVRLAVLAGILGLVAYVTTKVPRSASEEEATA